MSCYERQWTLILLEADRICEVFVTICRFELQARGKECTSRLCYSALLCGMLEVWQILSTVFQIHNYCLYWVSFDAGGTCISLQLSRSRIHSTCFRPKPMFSLSHFKQIIKKEGNISDSTGALLSTPPQRFGAV